MESPSHHTHLDLQEELDKRMKVDAVFESFTEGKVADDFHLPRNFDCLKTLVDKFETSCGKFDDYSLKYVKHLVNECETLKTPAGIVGSINRINSVCAH